MPITLIENFRAVFYAPFYAAFARGAYAAEGVEVNLTASPDPAETPNALLAGEGDVTWGGPMRVMRAYDRDPDCGLVIFCEVVARDPFFLVGREPRPEFRLEDLLDMKIGAVSEVPTPWLCLQHDLRLAGIDPARIDRVSDRSMAENAEALRSGALDAIQVFQPFVEDLVETGGGHIWRAAANRGLTTYTVLYTTRGFMERDPESLERMTRAMHRTLRWIAAHGGEEFAECVAPYFPDLPQKTLAKALARYKALGVWNENPVMAPESFEWLQAACLSGGLIREGVSYGRCVEMRFARQAAEENPPPGR
ncbi:MAG: ABC transporter substrate-binding protein [bacterium]